MQSRYYDPELGRFINADSYASTGQGVLGNNMFVYCNNNAVRYCDPSGNAFIEALIVAKGVDWAITIVICGIVIISGLVFELLETLLNWLSKQWYYCFARISYVEEKKTEQSPPDVTYPGDDPQKAPEGSEWKGRGPAGSKEGNYYDRANDRSWHPDLDHDPPIGPHWDLKDGGIWWRVFQDGTITVK